jgi:hypothetical protein
MRLDNRYGRLTVTDEIIIDPNGYNHKVICVCDCGNERPVFVSNLRRGATLSCGCYNVEATSKSNTTHGLAGTKTYKIWVAMKRRCQNSKDTNFARYGGRGIKVCERWQKFENFYKDMGAQPNGLTIERIDGNKDYQPDNCKWATYKEQANNVSSNQRYTLLIDGKWQTKNVTQWAEHFGIKPSTVFTRLFRGWSISQALVVPPTYAGRTS